MKINKLVYSCVLTASLLLVSCGNEDVVLDHDSSSDVPVMKVKIGCATIDDTRSRALKHTASSWNEAKIYDAMIIIYDTPLNSTGGNIVDKIYFSSPDLTNVETFDKSNYSAKYYHDDGTPQIVSDKFKPETCYGAEFVTELIDGQSYYALAVANIGDISRDLTNLDALRNYVYHGPMYKYPSGQADYPPSYTHFAMSAIGEEKFTYRKSDIVNGTYTLPVNLYVQRLAARVEFTYGMNDARLEYIWEPRTMSEEGTPCSPIWYDVIFPTAPTPENGIVYEYPFDSWRESTYFPIYPTTGKSDADRISGAVFVLDNVILKNTISETTGEYLFERNNNYGTNYIFGNENFDGDSNNPGYAQFEVVTPSSKTYNEWIIRQSNDQLGHQSCGRCTYNTATARGVAVFEYIRESTFSSHSDSNPYVTVRLEGRTNLIGGHFDNGTGNVVYDGTSGDKKSFAKVAVEFPIQHCMPTGAVKPNNKLAYAIVRNTVYHILIRFYAQGDDLLVRWWYYDTSSGTFVDQSYNAATFGEYILEHQTGTTPND